MNGTPRRGPGGFPATPQTSRSPAVRSPKTSTPSRPNVRSLPEVPRNVEQSRTGPWIPTHVLDPAQQRFYALAIYAALWAWRSYDFYVLAVDQESSFWQFLKWGFIDGVFMFGLPLFEIPWLEWSNTTSALLFVLHGALDFALMFRIGIPFQAWALSLLAYLWDSELAISERSVKPGPIVHNASLILGKQIINILPEGSAILNPNKHSFCLNSTVTHLDIPILINQTDPTEIEILRIDLDSSQNETIILKSKELKRMMAKVAKPQKLDPANPVQLHYTAKKTGVYLLKRIVDKSKLEVRPRMSSAVVAACPQARVRPTRPNRCRNDLSDVALVVEGIPPLRLKYRTNVGGRPREATELQGLMPEDFYSPLSKHTSQALIRTSREDVSWAQSQTVTVPLNETLGDGGIWTYAVEEVSDALGNFVSYVNHDEYERSRHKASAMQSFTVHERPTVVLAQCNVQSPLKVAKGNSVKLPVEYGSTGKRPIDSPHTLEYLFTPDADVLADGNHGPTAELKKQTMRSSREQPLISESGLYTIKSVTTEFCQGEVLEPASCLLQNPPEPKLSLTSEDIVSKCAGNPIGLRVGLDLVGSPPFYIKYRRQKAGDSRSPPEEIKVTTLRSTIELAPGEDEGAGHYTYTFLSIRDWVYGERPLHNLELVQDVKPSASAHFIESARMKQACIDDSVVFDVGLRGEGPLVLEYELIHNGKRTKRSVNVEEEHYTIKTEKLTSGGEYTISLASITDKMGCKEPLKAEAKVNVRHERPKAYFGNIDGKQAVVALEGKSVELPLRLTGSGPWRLEYENSDSKAVKRLDLSQANSKLRIDSEGTYQLLSVRDSVCPGFIDEKASQFSVAWIPRPKIAVLESPTMALENGQYTREAVCEGDEDSFDVSLSGTAPFEVGYEQRFKDPKSSKFSALKKRDLRALGGTASIRTDTTQSGTYEYKFTHLADNKYNHSPKHFSPLTVSQTVHPRPNARFDKPGKTYSYCSREEDGEEVIPLTLDGIPPFHLEVEIKHFGTPKPEISIHKGIMTNTYDLRIEHRKLHLGQSKVSIRKIRDARCTHKPPPGAPRVQISVHDAPTVTPLEDRTDFCVGEHVSFALGGQVPFTLHYTFNGKQHAAKVQGTTFARLAEKPGTFALTGLKDHASHCLNTLNLTRNIHPIPTVRLSGGQVSEVDIHEGGGTDLEFAFSGTPPFEFTYTRSTNAQKGRKSRVLEIKTEISYEERFRVPVQEEGTYEAVSIKDRWCGFARQVEGVEVGKKGQKLLQY